MSNLLERNLGTSLLRCIWLLRSLVAVLATIAALVNGTHAINLPQMFTSHAAISW